MSSIVVEELDNPIRHFAEFINLIESYIMDVICIDYPDARLTATKADFGLLEQLIYHAEPDDDYNVPPEVKESFYRGVTFAFSEILSKELGLKWGVVNGGPFSGLAMYEPSSNKVVYVRNMIDKYIDQHGDISFSTIYQNIAQMFDE